MIKVCIFDLDGTLTNTLNAIAHFGNTALEEFGFKTFPTERYKRFVGNGRSKLIERMLDAQGMLTPENYKAVCKSYDSKYEAEPLYDTLPYDGIPELLAELKKRGIKAAVCTNKPINVARDVVSTLFAEDTFARIRGGEDGVAAKPDPKCTLEIAKSLGASPDECLFIGDSNVDMLTAKNADMISIGVLWGFRDEDELKAAGAKHIVKAPDEILGLL